VHGEKRHAGVGDRHMSKRLDGDGNEVDDRITDARVRQQCRAASRMIVITAVLATTECRPTRRTSRLVALRGCCRRLIAVHLAYDSEHGLRRDQ